jgi:hypothetical protein
VAGGADVSDPTRIVDCSDDTLVFQTAPTPENNHWFDVIYGNGLYVSVAELGAGVLTTSTDGINWVDQALPAGQWESATYADGRFVAVGTNNVTYADCQ